MGTRRSRWQHIDDNIREVDSVAGLYSGIGDPSEGVIQLCTRSEFYDERPAFLCTKHGFAKSANSHKSTPSSRQALTSLFDQAILRSRVVAPLQMGPRRDYDVHCKGPLHSVALAHGHEIGLF